jgi:hypothetical protein
VRRACLATALLVGACFAPDLGGAPFACGDGDRCPDGYQCGSDRLCRTPGAQPPPPDARPPSADAAPACTPGTRVCDGDRLVDCSLQGVPTIVECQMGCDPGTRACATLVASNLGLAACTASATPQSVTVAGELRLDTENCTGSLGGVVVGQGAGNPELCVMRAGDFTVQSGATLTIRGRRAAVLVALGRMTIAGTIDAAARGPIPGPGASLTATVPRGGSGGPNTAQGGGGGGHAVTGGLGGPIENGDTQHPGGMAIGTVALVPLTAGGFGGAGGYPCMVPPCPLREIGGGGGGALQLVACRELVIAATAVIDAGGGGGLGGAGGTLGLLPGAGDGGGAGGGVLVEAPMVTVPSGASIVANGGAGGGGGAPGTAAPSGQPGQDGLVAERPAEGGDGGDDPGGNGGDGGDGGSDADPDDGNAGSTGGGGGGAPGRIRINSRTGRPPSVAAGAIVSPQPSTGVVGRHP